MRKKTISLIAAVTALSISCTPLSAAAVEYATVLASSASANADVETQAFDESGPKLTSLKVGDTALTSFNANTADYTYDIAYSAWKDYTEEEISVEAEADSGATAELNSDKVTIRNSDGNKKADSEVATVTITVTDNENSASTNTYTIKFVLKACPHTNTTKNEEKSEAATCDVAGKNVYTCDDCSTEIEEQVAALAHSYGSWSTTTEPTCTEDGVKTKTCSKCGDEQTETIEATGHSYTDVTTDPTCTTPGKTVSTCDNCDDEKETPIPALGHSFGATWSKDAEKHWHECTNAGCSEKSDEEAHTKNAGTVTTAPTTSAAGVRTFACTICEQSMGTEEIPTLSEDHDSDDKHTFHDEWVFDASKHWHECDCSAKSDEANHTLVEEVTIPATTTATGILTKSCECGYTVTSTIPLHTHSVSADWTSNDTKHWKTCSGCDEHLQEAAHTWNAGTVTTEATETTAGVKTYTCTTCDKTKTETIPATGSPVTPPSEDEGGDVTVDAPAIAEDVTTTIETSSSAITSAVDLTEEEIALGVSLSLNVETADLSTSEIAKVDDTAESAGLTVNSDCQLDIKIIKKVGGDTVGEEVTDLKSSIPITVTVPASAVNTDPAKTREYFVIHLHDGIAEIIPASFSSGKITFAVRGFSAFILAYKDTDINSEPEPAPAPAAPTTYSVTVNGGATVTGDRTAGSVMKVTVPYYMTARVYRGDALIATLWGGGTFTMPAGNVTIVVTDDSGAALMSSSAPNSYIFSYDSQMKLIKTTRSKKGIRGTGEITVKLGAEYAGKSVTLYSGKNSTANKIDEAVLDAKGNATFTVEGAKNYTLVVED